MEHIPGRHSSIPNRWLRPVGAYLRPCPTVRRDADRIALTLIELTEFVERHNRCTSQPQVVAPSPDTGPTTHGGVVVGLLASKPNTQGSLGLTSIPFDVTVGGSFGIWVELRGDQNGGEWGLHTQLTYVSEELRGTGQYLNVAIDHNAVRLAIAPRAYVSIDRQEFYVEAGPVLSHSLVYNEDVSPRGASSTRTFPYLPSDFRRFAYGVLVGSGFTYNRLSVGARLSIHMGYSNVPGSVYQMTNRSLGLLVGYRF